LNNHQDSRTDKAEKVRKRTKYVNWAFSSVFLIIIFCQTFYWLFANQLDPILVGMPFGLFFITALIVLEFIGLILLYKFQEK
jgi:uncharacterized membrane protein